MSKVISLEDIKQSKKSKVIAEELDICINILRLTIKGLRLFRYYSPIQDLLPQLQDTKTILEIHKNQQLNLIDHDE
jgi:hypothetical protein